MMFERGVAEYLYLTRAEIMRYWKKERSEKLHKLCFAKPLCNGQVKGDEMEGTCSTHGRDAKVGKRGGNVHFSRYERRREKIILKCILKRQRWSGFTWFRIRISDGLLL
jgi:hypothetical protein